MGDLHLGSRVLPIARVAEQADDFFVGGLRKVGIMRADGVKRVRLLQACSPRFRRWSRRSASATRPQPSAAWPRSAALGTSSTPSSIACRSAAIPISISAACGPISMAGKTIPRSAQAWSMRACLCRRRAAGVSRSDWLTKLNHADHGCVIRHPARAGPASYVPR